MTKLVCEVVFNFNFISLNLCIGQNVKLGLFFTLFEWKGVDIYYFFSQKILWNKEASLKLYSMNSIELRRLKSWPRNLKRKLWILRLSTFCSFRFIQKWKKCFNPEFWIKLSNFIQNITALFEEFCMRKVLMPSIYKGYIFSRFSKAASATIFSTLLTYWSS